MDFQELATQFVHNDINFRIEQNYQKVNYPQIKGENVALILISNQPKSITAGKLADLMNVSTARVACILNSLESKKLIRRLADKFDKRKIFVALTKLGRESIEKQHDAVVSYFAEFFKSIGQEDTQKYLELTNKLHEFITTRRPCDDTII